MKGASIHNKTTKQQLSVIIALAVPAMIENLLQMVVGFADTLFVAKLGLNEVAAAIWFDYPLF